MRQSRKIATRIQAHGSCVKTGSKCTNQHAGIWTNHSAAAAAAAARTLQQVRMTSLPANQRSSRHCRPSPSAIKGADAVELVTLLSQILKLTHRRDILGVRPTRTPDLHLVWSWREPSSPYTRRTTTNDHLVLYNRTFAVYAVNKVRNRRTTSDT